MDTKEHAGKFMKNALHVLRYAKRPIWAEVILEMKKIKSITSAIVELAQSGS